ncbi:MAG: GNAT family N-acetyltransferase [Chloroflexi bacterium]|nr:MAG: GNAT family N-acetyltransferase [Chloroflexota bacterium]
MTLSNLNGEFATIIATDTLLERLRREDPIRPVGEIVQRGEAEVPSPRLLAGRTVTLEPVDPDTHFRSLFKASRADSTIWDYLPHGPFEQEDEFLSWLLWAKSSPEHIFLTVVDLSTGRAEGMVSYMRVSPAHRRIEIGYIWFGPRLRRTTAATEAIFLLLSHAFDDLGYRRVEWKCNALNRPSCAAAGRFGFTYEGIFRQHMVVKGRNRDTAWFAMLDKDWPPARAAFEKWLSAENFDGNGKQRQPLSAIRASVA